MSINKNCFMCHYTANIQPWQIVSHSEFHLEQLLSHDKTNKTNKHQVYWNTLIEHTPNWSQILGFCSAVHHPTC